MTYKQKTQPTTNSVTEFLNQIESPARRADCQVLLQLFEKTTNAPPVMWGETMIGFGHYHYKYASGHEGDAFLVGFSPRKANISLYFAPGADREALLAKLGKHKSGKACVYINTVADVDLTVIESLIVASITFLRTTYPD